MPMGSDEWLGEIELDWNGNYHEMRQFWSEHLGKKEDWIKKVESLLPEVERLAREAKILLSNLEGGLDQVSFASAMTRHESVAMNLSKASGNQAWPPLDCQECDQVFSSMVNQLHNAFVPFAAWSRANWDWANQLWLAKYHLGLYADERGTFLHEWKKLGHR